MARFSVASPRFPGCGLVETDFLTWKLLKPRVRTLRRGGVRLEREPGGSLVDSDLRLIHQRRRAPVAPRYFIAQPHVRLPDAFRDRLEGDALGPFDSQPRAAENRVLAGGEGGEVPAVLGALAADAVVDLAVGLVAAGVLEAVGEDRDDHLAGALRLGRGGEAVAEVIGRSAHLVE